MGGWQLHTCILFHGLVCSHSGSACSTSPQPNEVSYIVASVVVLRPWSIPRRMEMATLVLSGDICVDGFASLGEQLLPCCIHCCHCIVCLFSYMNTTNCSIFSNASCDRFAFSVPTSKKANATIGNAVQAFQAFSFFRSSQRMRPCHNQLQRERQAKLLICLPDRR